MVASNAGKGYLLTPLPVKKRQCKAAT